VGKRRRKKRKQRKQRTSVPKKPTLADLNKLKPLLVRAAQQVYNEWAQDEKGWDEYLGTGGICQDVTDAFLEVLFHHDIMGVPFVPTIGENHVWAVADLKEGAYRVDIPAEVYETGGGYSWKKKPNVVFEEDDLIIEDMGFPFRDYVEDFGI